MHRLLSDGTFNYEYDNEGNIVLRTHIATGSVTEYTYDHRNRLTTVAERDSAAGPATQIVTFTYDANDNRLSLTDAELNETTFAYDNLNRLISQTDPTGQITQFAYDSVDNLIETIDRNGRFT